MIKYNSLKKFLQAHIFICTCFCYSQNYDFKKIESYIDEYENDSALVFLKQIKSEKLTDFDLGKKNYFLGKAYMQNDNSDSAYIKTLLAKKTFKEINAFRDVALCNISILQILSHQNEIDLNTRPIIKELQDYAKTNDEYLIKRTIYYNLASFYMDENKGQLAKDYFDKYIEVASQNNDSLYVAYGLMNKGVVFNEYIKNPDSALFYFQKPMPYFLQKSDNMTILYNYNNQGKAYYNLKAYDRAIKYYNKADSIRISLSISAPELIHYKNLYEAYKEKKDYKNFSKYLELYGRLKDSINRLDQNKAIIDAKEKYETEKKEKENIKLQTNLDNQQRKQRNLWFASISILLFGSIIFYLIQKNTKRKQKLAEQEKALETQKLATVLKEQELNAIDAMIEGQEKERQRIANDLHDDLGGLMATVKLHFNALKEKQTPELYTKTNQLIDEAYDKVRTVAHAKNSGVIAKQGLLKAVTQMADNISVANKIKIDVIDHGLENRLENSLELTIFRIIQELITNVIKHAEASEVSIHITNHDDSLNLMVEDNGKGFNPSQVTKTNKGMGISSIDKRVSHLEGTMTIESEKQQGTTIIIDIPL